MANVRLEDIKRRFNNVTAIEDITFEIPDGEFWVLVGPIWLWEVYNFTSDRWFGKRDFWQTLYWRSLSK